MFKPFNPLEDSKLFFGNRRNQDTLLDTLGQAVVTGGNELLLVSGGTGTGKSEVIKKFMQSMKKDEHYKPLKSSDPALPPALSKHLRMIKNKIEVNHVIYMDRDKPFYVVVAKDETALADREQAEILKETASLIGNKEKGYNVVWIADAPIPYQSASIFKPKTEARKPLNEHGQRLEVLEKTFPDVVKAHTLTYDTQQIRQVLWDHITTYGQSFLTFLKEGKTHWENSSEWDNVTKAALKKDRDAYDKAFDALVAKREQERKGGIAA